MMIQATTRHAHVWLATIFGVFTALAAESANAACGEIAVSKGDVKIENSKTKKAVPAEKGSKVCQGDIVVAGPMARAKVVMEDGNELNISPESRIVLEEYVYKPADNKKKVMLNVLYGKVRTATKEENMYGDKAADGQANSFQVKTKSAVAGVRGTDFLTSFDRRSNRAEVITFRGRVEVGTLGPRGVILNAVNVGAGQKTEAVLGQPPSPPKSVPKVDMDRANNDSKADVASGGAGVPGGSSGGSSSGGGSSDSSSGSSSNASSERSGEGGEQGSGRNSNSGPNSRRPAANGPRMISSEDLAKDDKAPVPAPRAPAGLTVAPPPPLPPPVVPTPPPVTTCDLCNRAIESGPGKVKITITVPQ